MKNANPKGRRLVIFMKYPKAGFSKTRLIPALGAAGAADLHREMAIRTMAVGQASADLAGCTIGIYGTGASVSEFRDAFGEADYREQCEGDLGARMLIAFRESLTQADSAVIVGTDCPALTPATIHAAFAGLVDHDLVLGPSEDGGYYLIGLRQPHEDLFRDMPWGTGEVFAETIRRSAALGLRTRLTQKLPDVDEPPDLVHWERRRNLVAGTAPALTIVIPARDEADRIGATIDTIRCDHVQIIVADGGSTDETLSIAARHGALVVESTPGRGPQQNAGAMQALGPVLLFLHADTILPEDYLERVLETLADPSVALGAFGLRIDHPSAKARFVEAAVGWRCSVIGMPYGDQAFFLRAESFHRIGGFAEVPLMEDVEIVRAARRLGHVRMIDGYVITSGRRWAKAGVFRMSMINLACLAAYMCRVPPGRIASFRDRLSGRTTKAPRR